LLIWGEGKRKSGRKKKKQERMRGVKNQNRIIIKCHNYNKIKFWKKIK